jgi:tRNA modification GTPase
MNHYLQDTIVALATPPIKSALAIVRMSGSQSLPIFQRMFSKPVQRVDAKTILTGWIVDGKQKVDQVVALVYQNPHSFTGEDSVEIIAHGSPLITQEIIQLCLAYGARLAEPGEFSSRAFLNQKIDLIQAEAIHDMIDAVTPEAKKLSLMALDGQTSRQIEPIKTSIADLLALIEVNIDYPEYEDIERVTLAKVIEASHAMVKQLNILLEQGQKGRLIKEGIRLAIVGRPNVGKSSLLNALIRDEKAIVTDVEGTTRDVVEAEISLDGVYLKILDTAGIRHSEDVVEKIGIQKSIQAVEKADLILYVMDGQHPQRIEDEVFSTILETKKVIDVYNKKDLMKDADKVAVAISAKHNDITPLLEEIKRVLGLQAIDFQQPSFHNTRQLGALERIKNHLNQVIHDTERDATMDLLSSSLQLAYEEIMILLGLEGKVDLSEEIFSRFCVGK